MRNATLFASTIASASAVLALTPAQAQETVTYEFTQAGFEGGGTIRGIIRGVDLDGDGRLYSLPSGIADFLGVPPGNEVDYVEVTFDGFNRVKPYTVVYDKSVADIEDPGNAFMGFAYNLNGGDIGDEPDEGISLARFAPSTSYTMGEFFAPYINPFPFDDVLLTPCGTGGTCAAIIEYNQNVEVIYSDFSAGAVDTTPLEDVGGRSYLVEVRDFLGNTFTDCLRFDEFGGLTVDGLGQTLTWRRKRLDMSPNGWQATSRSGAALPIAFDGLLAGRTIRGNGIDERGDTYLIRGEENESCALGPQYDAADWQR
jgi:hypothetical protein